MSYKNNLRKWNDDIDLNNQLRHEYVDVWKSESQNLSDNMSAFIFNSKEVICNKEINIVNWDYDKKTGKFVIEVNC